MKEPCDFFATSMNTLVFGRTFANLRKHGKTAKNRYFLRYSCRIVFCKVFEETARMVVYVGA
jgi:hypothetical protein